MNDPHSKQATPNGGDFLDMTFAPERTLSNYARVLREMYDELFELNITRNTYQILFSRQGKYMGPSPSGVLSETVIEISEYIIHPGDRARFIAFFDINRVRAAFAAGERSLSVEFRKRRVNKNYEWVQATLLPVTETEDEVLICYILDIHQRKIMEESNELMQEICRVAVANDYGFVCLVQVSTRSYTIYKFDGTPNALLDHGDFDSMLRQVSEDIRDDERPAFFDSMLLDHVLKALDSGQPQHVVSYRIRRNGVWQWHNTILSYFRNNRDMILCTTRDVTALYEAKEKEHHLQQQFLHSFGSVYSDIIELDPCAGCGLVMKSHFSPNFENSLRPLNELLDLFLLQRVHEDDLELMTSSFSERALCDFLDSGVGQKNLEIRYQTDANTYEWVDVSLSAMQGQAGLSRKVLLTMRNVNERRLLKEIVDRFVYASHDYFVRIDAHRDRFTMYSNKNNLEIATSPTAKYSDCLIEYNTKFVVPEDLERVNEAMRLDTVLKQLDENGEWSFFCTTHDEGSRRRKRLQFSYFDRHNKQILLTRMDVTDVYEEERRKNDLLREALHQAKTANRAKTDFLSRISHDIRTPMNAIMGMIAIALSRFEQTDRVRDCLHKIENSSHYLLALLNDVLDMSRIESGAMTIIRHPFSFAVFARNLLTLVQPQAAVKGLCLSVEVDPSVESVYDGDMLRLNQIVLNLVSNSIKYTSSGGRVDVRIRESGRHGHVASLELQVADTGCGMSPEFMRRMFDPFEQETQDVARDHVGSGLGLPIVQHLARLMDGTISAQSEPGRGSVFTVTVGLGIVDETCPEYARRQYVDVQLYGERVLVVDDDSVSREHTAILLEELGCVPECLPSGEAALAHLIAQESVGADGCGHVPYAAVFVDWRMPGLSGLDTVRGIRERWRGKPLIAIMSAYDQSQIELETLSIGVDGFLPKPLSQRLVQELFTRWRPPTGQLAERKLFCGQRVLVVEDNDINMEIACDLLENEQLIPERAENGRQAVDMFNAAPLNWYVGVLMDVRMPILDGLDATRAIRALPRDDARTVAIIGMSANAFQDDINKAMEAGMDCYLVKPVDASALHDALITWIADRVHK